MSNMTFLDLEVLSTWALRIGEQFYSYSSLGIRLERFKCQWRGENTTGCL